MKIARRAALAALCFVAGTWPAQAAPVAAGFNHAAVVDSAGNVWTWGRNNSGQLGNGGTTPTAVPVQLSSPTNVVAVAAGEAHTLALTADGEVYAWGANGWGQVGDATTTTRKSPVQVAAGVVQIAAGQFHSVALKSDGTVVTWGFGGSGQMGDGTQLNKTSPQAVPNLSDVASIASGHGHVLVVKTDGSVWSWGLNGGGQVGDGTTTMRTAPVSVAALSGLSITALAGGEAHSLARAANGLVYAWGSNSYGQLGDGTINAHWTPNRVVDLQNVASISAGRTHSAAVESDGTTWGWGNGSRGALGDGVPLPATIPVPPAPGPVGIAAIAASDLHTFLVASDGTVWAYGANAYGEIGDGTTLDRFTPVKVLDAGFGPKVGTPVFSVTPGAYTTTKSVGLSSVTPGADIYYTTDGLEPTTSSTLYSGTLIPVDVTTTIRARAFKSGLGDSNAAHGLFTLRVASPAFTPTGGTYTSAQSVSMSTSTPGAAIRYELGGQAPTQSSQTYSAAVTVSSSTVVMAVASKTGWEDSYLTAGTYTLNYGTLAPPTMTPAPGTYAGSVTVSLSAAAGSTIRYTLDGTEPSATSPVYSSPLVLAASKTVKAKAFRSDWTASPTTTTAYVVEAAAPVFSPGAGTYSLGQQITLTSATTGARIHYTFDGSEPSQDDASVPSGGVIFVGTFTFKARVYATGVNASAVTTATYVQTGSGATGTVAAGASHSLVVKSDGTLLAWGSNGYGQLGDSSTTTRPTPVAAGTLSGVTAVAAGANHSLALKSDGTVWAFGSNASGQLGVGATPSSSTAPIQVTSLSGVVAIAAGANHSLAVKSDGSVWSWGANGSNQLGDNTATQRNTPVQVLSAGSALTGAVAVAAGANHSLALKGGGTVWSWGANGNGQLGDSSTTQRSQAVQVSTLSSVTGVEGGALHSIARTSDGSTWTWGSGGNGRLGTGNNNSSTSPVEVTQLPLARSGVAGQSFSASLSTDGRVSTWGQGYALGNGGSTATNVPAVVASLPQIVAVAAGDDHVVAVAEDGSIFAWGSNASGQVGDGTTVTRSTPVQVADANYSVRAGMPIFSHAAGTYSAAQSVTISSATPGATIHYTIDGTTPTTLSEAYSGAISIGTGTVLSARAVKSGLADSGVAVAAYTLKAPAPGVSPGTGTYAVSQTVTLTSPVSGATIRYTTDGSIPTVSSSGVSSGQTLAVSTSATVKASVWRSGWVTSDVTTATLSLKPSTPTFAPGGGSYTSAQTVTVSTSTSGATIRYTLSGLDPTETDAAVVFGSTVAVPRSSILKARAFHGGWVASDVASAVYAIAAGATATPTFSPAAGTFSATQSVAIVTNTPGAVIRYTVDGSDPTEWSPIFARPIAVAATATVKARAYAEGLPASAVATASYTINNSGRVEAPHLDVGSGAYTTRRTVTVTCGTTGATIHYTLDGSDPSDESESVASGATIAVDRSLVLKAAAWKAGMTSSAVTRRDYVVTGAVAARGTHTVVLKADGTVWTFGTNGAGELGDSTTTTRFSPVQVPSLTSVVAVAAGGNHTLAVKADGTLWAWGLNNFGQLGDGTTGTNRLSPVQVSGLTNVVAAAAGSYHSLALLADGTAKSWGYNIDGRLGNNSTATSHTPVAVSGLSSAIAIAAAVDHSLAVKSDGTVVAWGNNPNGQLGAATPSQSLVPMSVGSVVGAAGVAANSGFSLTAVPVGASGAGLWSFGYNASGQLGEGSLTIRKTAVAGPAAVRVFAAGDRHALAFRQDGTLVSWGAGDYGQLGDASIVTGQSSPVATLGAGEVVQVSAGSSYSVALRADGTLQTWGTGGAHLGLGDYPQRTVPTTVPAFSVVANAWMAADTDADGLSNAAEYRLGSDPLAADTNGDGLRDGVQTSGRGPATTDTDADGLANWLEIEKGADPLVADTDRDGTLDGADCFPLDASRTACGVSDPNDQTPPAITILEPAGATLNP